MELLTIYKKAFQIESQQQAFGSRRLKMSRALSRSLITTVLTLVAASAVHAEVLRIRPSANPSPSQTNSRVCVAPSAAEFFEPIDPSIPRRQSRPGCPMPQKLTLEPQEMNVEEAKDQILGMWRPQHTCDGEPIEASKTPDALNGIKLSQVNFVFYADGSGYRRDMGTYRAPRAPELPQDPPTPPKRFDSRFTYSVVRNSDGKLTLPMSGFTTLDLSFARIKETGEVVYLLDMTPYVSGVCAPGKKLYGVFTYIPNS